MALTREEIQKRCGWRYDPANGPRHLMALAKPRFRDAAPELLNDDNDGTYLPYLALRDVNGGVYPDYPMQAIGDCGSHATAKVIDLDQAVDIMIRNSPQEFEQACTEAIYGEARRIAGYLGGPDGSYGSALAKCVTTVGVASRRDLGPYDGDRAQLWGSIGAPPAVIELMGRAKCQGASQNQGLADINAGLRNGYFQLICSDQAFELVRDEDGYCPADFSTQWWHALTIMGKRKLPRPGYLIGQHWGDEDPTGPLSLDQPVWSFWADEMIVARMIGFNECYTCTRFGGYARRNLPPEYLLEGFAA